MHKAATLCEWAGRRGQDTIAFALAHIKYRPHALDFKEILFHFGLLESLPLLSPEIRCELAQVDVEEASIQARKQRTGNEQEAEHVHVADIVQSESSSSEYRRPAGAYE